MRRYYKYYVSNSHVIRALDRESAISKLKKLGVTTNIECHTTDYKKAVRVANSNGGVNYVLCNGSKSTKSGKG
jgi:hypothetical protein